MTEYFKQGPTIQMTHETYWTNTMPNYSKYLSDTLQVLKLDSKIIFQPGNIINEAKPFKEYPNKSFHHAATCPNCWSMNDFMINWSKITFQGKPATVGFHCLSCDLDFEESYGTA